jgi:thiamine-monophosphate kinase
MNEFELIKRVTHGSPRSLADLVQGIDDDCAILKGKNDKDILVTTDGLFEGVHFKMEWTSPKTIGRKALSVNISDIAAMGGKPLYYLVTVGIPEGFPSKDVEAIFEGMNQIASNFRMILIGGDTCASKSGLLLSVTVIGEIDSLKAILRNGANPGDLIYVTGTLGDSSLGLSCLTKGLRGINIREYIRRHTDPTPRVAVGQWLSASTCVSSMIDISDGLAKDLGHIGEMSKVGIKIFADLLPLSNGFNQAASSVNKDPLILALTGGEDYELAFTVSKQKVDLFEKMLKVVAPTFGHGVTKIGEVIEGEGVKVIDVHGTDIPLSNAGFEHKF